MYMQVVVKCRRNMKWKWDSERASLKWKFIGYPNGFRILQTDRTLYFTYSGGRENENGGKERKLLSLPTSFLPYLYVYSTKTESTDKKMK